MEKSTDGESWSNILPKILASEEKATTIIDGGLCYPTFKTTFSEICPLCFHVNKIPVPDISNIWPQSSGLTEPLWTDPGIKIGITVHELISTLKKKKGTRRSTCRERMVGHFHKILTSKKKLPPPNSQSRTTSLLRTLSIILRIVC